jgi:hypothetical protein
MRIFLTAILIAFISFSGLAQTSSADPVDIQGWYGVGLGLDLKKKWTLGLTIKRVFRTIWPLIKARTLVCLPPRVLISALISWRSTGWGWCKTLFFIDISGTGLRQP